MADLSDLTFEHAMERLEQSVRELEAGTKSLDDSLRLFQDGVALARFCARRLDEAEARIERLLETQGGVALRPMEGKELGE